MSDAATSNDIETKATPISWRVRMAILALFIFAVATVAVTNTYLTNRFTEATRSRAEVRLALYSGGLLAELQRNSIVPQLLARDPELIGALNSGNYTLSTQRLLTFAEEIDGAAITLFDASGRAVASTNRNALGGSHRSDPDFLNAIRSNDTIFTAQDGGEGAYRFTYSRRVEFVADVIGVISVEMDLGALERSWARTLDAVIVTDSEGVVILASEPRWRGSSIADALTRQTVPSAIERAFEATQGWSAIGVDTYVEGQAVLRQEARVPFQGWRMSTFTTYANVRERVNGVLAIEIMGFAILLALAFYFLSRRTASRLVFFQAESAELRALNERLQREVAEREKVQKTLEVAEQSLAQSSKLAALGEMSAAVSHELNQPLAAMKTYLAGAKLLLQRKRPDEALSSFQRIDDLISRMGAITRQLKSYARKGAEAFEPVDIRAAASSGLAMMEPQLKQRYVEILKTFPPAPVMVMADRLRLEQVIVNLLRNALDATKAEDTPEIEILIAAGDTVTLTVRDNGDGIENLDELFEPFYTTKSPGDGVGLGLAISSGIVKDLGGRLTARNAVAGGAVFEIQLPILEKDVEAAE